MYAAPDRVRALSAVCALVAEQPDDVMRARREEAEMIFRRVGITFAVYGARTTTLRRPRLIPFDSDSARAIPAQNGARWKGLERVTHQPLPARLPHEQEIVNRHSARARSRATQFRPEMVGVDTLPPAASTHIRHDIVARAGAGRGRG